MVSASSLPLWTGKAELPDEDLPAPELALTPVRATASDFTAASGRKPSSGGSNDQPARTVEEALASTWLAWVGTIAVALSAVFLFRYAVDQGCLTLLTRVVLGLLLSGFLLAAGE